MRAGGDREAERGATAGGEARNWDLGCASCTDGRTCPSPGRLLLPGPVRGRCGRGPWPSSGRTAPIPTPARWDWKLSNCALNPSHISLVPIQGGGSRALGPGGCGMEGWVAVGTAARGCGCASMAGSGCGSGAEQRREQCQVCERGQSVGGGVVKWPDPRNPETPGHFQSG